MPRLKSVTDANGTKIYPVTITRGVYDTDKNQRLDVTLANKADNTIMGASGSNHAPGLVPDTPSTAGTTKYLREDGTWQTPPNTTYSEATTSAAGLMSSSDKTKLNGIESGADVTDAENVKAALGTNSTHGGAFLRKDGTWQVPPNTTYGLSAGTGDDANKIVLTPSSGTADKITVPYASNAGTVNGKTVAKNVPSDAVFTDTTYESKAAANGGTDVSLVTTGEKYIWNNKQNALTFNTTPSSTNKVATMADIPNSLPANGGTAENVSGTVAIEHGGTGATTASAARTNLGLGSLATKSSLSVSDIPTLTPSKVGLSNVTNDALVKRSEMGAASGVATLDSAGKVPSSQLPSYVDDVLEYNTKSDFPTTGEAGKIYVNKATNTTWRWSGSAYTQIKGDLAIGNTTGTAADGGVANTHYNNTSNPHSVTKAQVGLGSVVNTGDSATPVSGGTTKFTTGGAYTELAKKVDKVDGKGLSTNDYTTNEKNKLSGIASGAQANVIETVKVNGTALTPSSKAVDVTVPTKTSELTNNSNFVSDASYVHTDNNYTATEKSKLSGIANGAEVNQNAFSNVGVKVGDTTTTVAADAKTDTVTLIQGSNITLTPDTTNDTVTIAAKDTTYSSKSEASGGTDLSLVTTGEKYTWNNKLDYNSRLFTTNDFALYQDKSLYISKIDNGLCLADKRFTTSMSINGATSFVPISLFDGDYETRYNIPDGLSAVITIDFSALPSSKFPGYPYGEIFVCFYGGRTPKTITGRVYNNYASLGVGWKTITFVLYRTGGTIYFANNNYYGLLTIEITIEARDSSTYNETGPCLIEFRMNRPGSNLTPMVSKYFAETLYFPLTAPSFIGNLTGKVNNYTINSNVPSNAVFTDTTYKLTIGSTTNGDSINGVNLGTLESKAAASSGTDLSLVTTGEKNTWNSKQNALTNPVTRSGSTALTANKIVLGNGNNTVIPSSYGITATAPSSTSDDTSIPTSKAVWSAVANGIAANDAMVYKGTIAGGSTGSYGALTSAANKGETYKVTAAGKINGIAVEVGDMLICNTDSTAAATSSNYSTIAANWDYIQANIDGAVVGPASSTDGNLASFNGATGKVVKDSGLTTTNVSDAVTKKHSHSSLTLSTTAQAYDGTHTLALPSSDPYSSARTPASHTHGNIQNGGTLLTNDVTIANGDKLVVTDSSDSNKVARTSVSFDGSTTTKALTLKGTFESFATSNTTYKFTIGTTTKGDSTNGVDLGTLKSETAVASGTTLSLVTTGEKATWNAKQNALTFTSTPSSTNKVVTLNDVPSALPANGGNADTVDGLHIVVVTSMPSSPDANTIYIVK